MKNILKVVITIFAIIIFSLCSPSNSYEGESYSFQAIQELYLEHSNDFQELADIISESHDFWEKGRRDIVSAHAWLTTPYDNEKIHLFTNEEQAIILNFFENTKPYMISLDEKKYVSIVYLNEDRSNSYTFVFYFSCMNYDDFEFKSWKGYVEANYENFIEIDYKWFLYY